MTSTKPPANKKNKASETAIDKKIAKKKQPAKRGPKPKYLDWITPHGLTLITGWARNGLTSQEIAKNVGIHPSTLCVWQNQFPEIDKAIKNGKEFSDLAVENALFNKAIRGDVGAICFYLKNRKPEKWRDKPMTDDELTKAQIEKARAEISLEKEKLELKMLRSMAGEDTTNSFAQMIEIVDLIRNPSEERTIDNVLESANKNDTENFAGFDPLSELTGGEIQ